MSYHSSARTRKSTNAEPLVSHSFLRRKCACRQNTNDSIENDLYNRQATNQSASIIVPPIVNDVLRSSGQSLSTTTRAFMESHFNYDFSKVKLHTVRSLVERRSEVAQSRYVDSVWVRWCVITEVKENRLAGVDCQPV